MIKPWFLLLKDMVERGVFPGIVHRVLVWSEQPGTGKSSFAHYQFGANNVERVTLHGRMVPDDLLFQVELEERNGATVTVRKDGAALRALKLGRVLVLDEIDQHDPAMRCLLHALLDDREIAGVTLSDGSRVVPAEGFGIIATSNKTPQAFAAPLLDRFDLVLHAALPNAAALERIPKAVSRLIENEHARAAQVNNWTPALSVRTGLTYGKLVPHVGAEMAAKLCFGTRWQDIVNACACAEQAVQSKAPKGASAR